jgi:hypothetical protein
VGGEGQGEEDCTADAGGNLLPYPLLPVEEGNQVSGNLASDTDAFGVLLRMKPSVFQALKESFMLSSQPQAGVSKHPTRLFVPGCETSLPLGAGRPRRPTKPATSDTSDISKEPGR